MDKEFIYSINGNLKEKCIENFGWADSFLKKKKIIGSSSSDIYKNESTYSNTDKSNYELKVFSQSYKDYNFDSIKNQLIADSKNEFITSVDDEINNILTNADYNDAKKIVELEKLKNGL